HHGYFQDGYGALESFVEQLNALDDRLEWTNLATICSRAHLTKTAADGAVHVRFYTSRFTLQNGGTEARRYLLFRSRARNGRADAVTAVMIDGHELDHEEDDDNVKIALTLNAGQIADVR